jgi:UDP-N-acetylmuramoyl-L-alanyl-D-glutamate--2,6-diaminopimelate ligase
MFPPPPPWSQNIVSAGITGTNGKTTTTTYLAQILETQHVPVLRVTTLGFYLGPEKLDLPADYEGFLEAHRRALAAGARRSVLECTSEALGVGFAKAWPISMGIFTNLTRDHLDTHGSAEHYLASKAQLFLHLPSNGVAVLNAFDSASALLFEIIPRGVRIVTYGVPSRSSNAPVMPIDLTPERIHVDWTGTRVTLAAQKDEESRTFQLAAIGEIYVENALAALLAARQAGVSLDAALGALEQTPPVPGRFEVLGVGPRGVVDYGHSPDALERTLRTARLLCKGKLTVVFGAGGGRDRGKRPGMGQAARMADEIILTSDNPRAEDPRIIAEEIRLGLTNHSGVSMILDRAAAITRAFERANSEDVVVVAGRGPETEQVWKGEKRRLVDADIVRAALGIAGG